MTFARQLSLLLVACTCMANVRAADEGSAAAKTARGTPSPASDPQNRGGWILNMEISDEFNGERIDRKKWFVQGTDGKYYIWKGRPPSQFAPHNVFQEGGKLKIRTQWKPDFPFARESYADGDRNDSYPSNSRQTLAGLNDHPAQMSSPARRCVSRIDESQTRFGIAALRKMRDGFGYRVAQPDLIRSGNGDQLFVLFGSRIL